MEFKNIFLKIRKRKGREGIMYTGLIVKESIQNEKILDEIEIVKVEIWKTNNTPKYWTAISFTSSCEEFPEHLSKTLSRSSVSGMVWYVDIQDAVYKYIVLKDVVLKYHLENKEEKKSVCKKCMELGVKKEQLDWCF